MFLKQSETRYQIGKTEMRTDRIAILVKRAALKIDKISNPILAKYGLTAAQYRVLKYLYSKPNKTARIVDIEKECSITHPTALGILDNLSKKGFAEKIVNPDDSRSKVIALTKKAGDMQSELEGVGDQLEKTITKNLTAEEKKKLLSLLQKMLGTNGEK